MQRFPTLRLQKGSKLYVTHIKYVACSKLMYVKLSSFLASQLLSFQEIYRGPLHTTKSLPILWQIKRNFIGSWMQPSITWEESHGHWQRGVIHMFWVGLRFGILCGTQCVDIARRMRQPSTSGYHSTEDIDFGNQFMPQRMPLCGRAWPKTSPHLSVTWKRPPVFEGMPFRNNTSTHVQFTPDKGKKKGSTVNGAASYCTLQDLNVGATTVVKKTPISFPYVPVQLLLSTKLCTGH